MIRISHPKTELLMVAGVSRHLVLAELIESEVARYAGRKS
jgi:hypothetical protein